MQYFELIVCYIKYSVATNKRFSPKLSLTNNKKEKNNRGANTDHIFVRTDKNWKH